MTVTCTITCRVIDAHGGEPREVQAVPGQSLMRSLKDAGVDIEASCEGCMACGTCMVHLADGWHERVPAAAPDEEAMLEWLEQRRPTSRLACQIRLDDSMDGIALEVAA